MFKKILVPVDGSEGSWRALDTAVELGKKFGGELHVINVIQPYITPTAMTKENNSTM